MPLVKYPIKSKQLQFLISALQIHTNECQMWPFACDTNGYGMVWFDGKHEGAHQLAIQLVSDRWNPLLQSLHRCDNPPCFNPRHLFQGTQQENMDDRERKGRGVRFHGEKHGCSKSTSFKSGSAMILANRLPDLGKNSM